MQVIKFVNKFRARIFLNEDLMVKKENRYFLLNKKLKDLITKDFFYAGLYLGKVRNKRFFPSFNLLKMIAEKRSNKVIVDKKTEWLFICGRDVFKKGIIKVVGSGRKGDYTLVLNTHRECLGFGRILHDLNKMEDEDAVAVKNVLDIGDFLRREKGQP